MTPVRRSLRLAAVFLALIPAAVLAQADPSLIGRRVLPKFGAVIRRDRVEADAERLEPRRHGGLRAAIRIYRVERVEGDRLRVVAEEGDNRGWVGADEVVVFDRAVEYFTDLIRDHPDKPDYLLGRGNVFWERGEFDRAIADYTGAIRLMPDGGEVAYLNRGMAWAAKRQFDPAIADFDRALLIDPEFAAAYAHRGRARSGQGRFDAAVADLDRAIQLDPGDAGAYRSRGEARLGRKEFDRAIADFDAALLLEPKSATTHVARGVARSRNGDRDGAMTDYTEAIRLDPGGATAYHNRALLRYARGEVEGSLADCSEAIRLDPSDAAAYRVRARIWAGRKAFARARADLERVVSIRPDGGSYNDLAFLLASCPEAACRDGARAVDAARRAGELTGWKSPGVLDTLAAAYAEAGDFVKAVEWQTKALDQLPREDEKSKEDFQSRLEMYQAGRPYRQPSGDE